MTAVPQRNLPAAVAILLATLACTGCGTPGAPLPPSLKLPDPVTNLTASRTGNQVTLAWTMPKKTTDKLLIKGSIPVRVCRKEPSGGCEAVGSTLSSAPAAKATFSDSLPAPLASGAARPLSYFVELLSPRGRSAGPSNSAHILAGAAPAPVSGLTAQLRKDGVILRWDSDPATEQASSVIRLHRKLLTPPVKAASATKGQPDLLTPSREPLEQTLLVEPAEQPGRALDKSIVFNRTYQYRAQRVARVTVDGQTVELDGPISDPIRVEAIDVFPPAVATGLAAVATAADRSAGASIDLSWLPITESDVAGYAVYRRENASQPWQRISPAQPVIGPAFHDPQVQSGHTYIYAVTAIDALGHESARSAQAEETVPNP